jgi:hypothetical protein
MAVKRVQIQATYKGYYGGPVIDYHIVSEGSFAYDASLQACIRQGWGAAACPYWIDQDGNSRVKYGGRPVDSFLKEFPEMEDEVVEKFEEAGIRIYKS